MCVFTTSFLRTRCAGLFDPGPRARPRFSRLLIFLSFRGPLVLAISSVSVPSASEPTSIPCLFYHLEKRLILFDLFSITCILRPSLSTLNSTLAQKGGVGGQPRAARRNRRGPAENRFAAHDRRRNYRKIGGLR